jgi:hypothetical protein
MKILIVLIFTLFSQSIFAQDYEIRRFEARDYRDFSMDELQLLLGGSASLIPLLSCNGVDEFNPFKAPLRTNPNGDSLKIRVPKTNTYYTYNRGSFFDDKGKKVGILTLSQDSFVLKVASTLSRFEKIEPTRRLLRFFEESYFPIVIDLGRNSFAPTVEGERMYSGIKMAQAVAFLGTKRMSDGGMFADIGVGGSILWNPNGKITTIESDGVTRVLDNDVGLAHEMYHAFDSIRGLLDMGNVLGPSYAFEGIVEYRGVYFENLIRKHLGIKYRKFYGDPVSKDAPDMLNENGEPILIPAPCL